MPRMDKLSSYRTAWHENGDQGGVVYRNTEIVRWDGDTVTLSSGGWASVATRHKMNQAAKQFAKRYEVFQREYVWYVKDREGNVQKFHDGITVAA